MREIRTTGLTPKSNSRVPIRNTVYKYKYRSNLKNGEEDLKKAAWYMGKIFELTGKEPYQSNKNITK